ncbi:ribosome maturation factor RimM [Puia sp. P3]|uniref:ribosome maturation factor RimM n=1 Tax=Puia sp. P3 TaxID=3423952 RepID=UPI003D6646AF
MANNYRNIGKLVAVFGLQGELVLQHRLGKKTTLKGLKAIFIEDKKDEMLPWFVQATRPRSDEELYIKLEGLDTKETARRVVQKEVWLTEADFAQYAGSSAPISLVGFRMLDGKTDLGEILEVIEQPHRGPLQDRPRRRQRSPDPRPRRDPAESRQKEKGSPRGVARRVVGCVSVDLIVLFPGCFGYPLPSQRLGKVHHRFAESDHPVRPGAGTCADTPDLPFVVIDSKRVRSAVGPVHRITAIRGWKIGIIQYAVQALSGTRKALRISASL